MRHIRKSVCCVVIVNNWMPLSGIKALVVRLFVIDICVCVCSIETIHVHNTHSFSLEMLRCTYKNNKFNGNNKRTILCKQMRRKIRLKNFNLLKHTHRLKLASHLIFAHVDNVTVSFFHRLYIVHFHYIFHAA